MLLGLFKSGTGEDRKETSNGIHGKTWFRYKLACWVLILHVDRVRVVLCVCKEEGSYLHGYK